MEEKQDQLSLTSKETKSLNNIKFMNIIKKKVCCLPVWAILLIAAVTLLIISAIIIAITTILVVTLPNRQQRPNPPVWLTQRSVVSASTSEQVVKNTRNRRSADSSADPNTTPFPGGTTTSIVYPNWNESQNVSSPVIKTTSIVLSSSPTEVMILIVHGNVSVLQVNNTFSTTTTQRPSGVNRRKRDTSSDNGNSTSLKDVPMLLVTADPYTGNITSYKGTKNCSDSFKNVGLVVARSMLTNQNPDAYNPQTSGASRKRRAAVLGDCAHLEDIGGSAYCPQFSQHKTATRTVYRKQYSNGNALLRDASNQNVDMNVQIETQVSNDNQTLVKSQVTGNATLNAISTKENGTQQITLQKSVNTNFSVDNSSLNDVAIDKLNSLVAGIDFQEVDQKSSSTVRTNNYTGNFTDLRNSTFNTSLTRKRRDTDSRVGITIFNVFGADVDFIVDLAVHGNEATATVDLAVGPFDFPIAQKNLGSGVANAINQLLNLRAYAKTILDNTKNIVSAFVSSVNLDFVTSINGRVAIIKTDVNNLKAAFLRPVTQIATEVQNYKTKVLAVRDAVVANFTSLIQAANDQISQIKQQAQSVISLKNTSIAQQIAPFQQAYDNAVAQISSITSDINAITTFFSSQNPILQGLIQTFQNLLSDLNAVYTGAQTDVQTFISNEQSSASSTVQAIQNSATSAIQSLKDEAAADIAKYQTYLTQKAADFSNLLNATKIQIANISSEIANLQAQATTATGSAANNLQIQIANLTQLLTNFQQAKSQLESIQSALSTHLNALISKRQAELTQMISNTQAAVNSKLQAYQQYTNQSAQRFQQAAQETLQLLLTYLNKELGVNQNSSVRLSDVKNAILSMVSSAVHSALNLLQNIENDFLSLSNNLLTGFQSMLPGIGADTQSILAQVNSDAQTVGSNLLSIANTQVGNYKQIKQAVLSELQTFSSNMDGTLTSLGNQVASLPQALLNLEGSALESYYHEESELLSLIESDYQNFTSDIQAKITSFATATQSDAQTFVATLQSNFQNLTTQLQAKLSSAQSLFQTAFNASIVNSVNQFNTFASTINDLVTRFERYTNLTALQTTWQGLKTSASNSIASLQDTLNSFIAQKQSETQALVSSVQDSINVLQGKLTAIAQNTYSFALDLKNAGLTSIDNIFASFSQAENDIPLILANITGEGQLIWNDMNTGLSNFKSSLSTASNQIYSSFNNIAGMSTASNTDGGSIFDWAFISDDISSVKTSFNTITTGINSARDLLDGQIQSLLTDIKSVVDPNAWVQAYQSAIGQVNQLQSTLNYQANTPQRTQSSVQSSGTSISSDSQQKTSSVSVADVASSGSSSNLQTTISQLVNANSLRDGLINAFLSKLVIPVHDIILFRKSWNFPLAEIPTPIGIIGVGINLYIGADIKIGIILSPSKFAAVVTPGANLMLGADAFWSIIIIQVTASVGAQASVSIPVELGVSTQHFGIYVSAELDYSLAGYAGMYVQFLYPEIIWICFPIPIYYPCGISCGCGDCWCWCWIDWCEFDLWICIPIIIWVWSEPIWFLYTSFGGTSNSVSLFNKSLR